MTVGSIDKDLADAVDNYLMQCNLRVQLIKAESIDNLFNFWIKV